ncbi:inositol monophosphatase [Nonomuraea phyllanthi]|uniref:inositol monophosphatase family protein n=1 Tax=Nonomuraea phyllanthi TaxID=2219224 RepID=UPI0012933B2D|nr:inositol monophosphatase family protein [Nonomuraea phyllanthi]QFY07560.1 inositol monophosphatase [Nonomuraea phyllanthi]
MTGPLNEWHDLAVELAAWACDVIANGRPDPATAETKVNAADWVTSFDREVEQHVRGELRRLLPGHRVVGEEYGADPGESAVTWYLDPIDGTTNFVHGLPWVAFSLAACDEQGAAVGVVADVHRGEVFSAMRGGGARLNGEPVRCDEKASLTGGVLLTEWSRQEAWPGMYDYLSRVSATCGSTRIMGSCALALATVGAGRAAGVVLSGHYNAWDVAAGVLIARESGALIFDREGRHDDVPLHGVLAAPSSSAEELWRTWVGTP